MQVKRKFQEELISSIKNGIQKRVLEANASAIIFISTVLGFLVNAWLFLICGFISFYLLMHALVGWCPPLPIIRKLGVRTVYEICMEKMILKHLRGDFNDISLDAAKLIEAAKIEFSEGT